MSVSRRAILKGAVTAGAVATLPARAFAARAHGVAIYDSRIAEARAFAAQARRSGRVLIDLAREESQGWSTLRALPVNLRSVTGLTGWSDWVSVRGLLEERGLRLVDENAVQAPVSGKAHLFGWSMARRG